jgi:hypothetical protein
VLLSNGASRLVDLFGLATWEELLALLDENGSDELLRQVRAAEAVDPEGRQWPRTKRSDDATAVYLVVNRAKESNLDRLNDATARIWAVRGIDTLAPIHQLPASVVPRLIDLSHPPPRACFKSHSHSLIAAMCTVAR